MKRLWFAIKAVLMLIAVIVIISVYWTAAYFLSEWVYARLNWQPHPLAPATHDIDPGLLFVWIQHERHRTVHTKA